MQPNEQLANDLRAALKRLCGEGAASFQTIAATVTAVDTSTYTVDVQPADGGADIFDVRLRASVDGTDGGFFCVPTVGSFVLVTAINNDWNSAFVSQVSGVSQIVMDGGDKGGLAIVSRLVSQFNRLENKLNDLQTLLSTHVHTPPTAPAATLAALTPILPLTQDSDIENKKILH